MDARHGGARILTACGVVDVARILAAPAHGGGEVLWGTAAWTAFVRLTPTTGSNHKAEPNRAA
jgi:hypothetical protein